ncbi:MAG: PEPxxWA-CTERM sorting domain-containing protein [Caulobacteraceae bacterium]
MTKSKLFLAAASAAVAIAGAASAGVVYNNPFDFNADVGDCSFSTTCAAQIGAGDDFAAQKFTLLSDAVITSASFSELDFKVFPTVANWGFIMADGAGGLPGTILAAGSDDITSSPSIGSGTIHGAPANVSQNFFDVGTVALSAGTYYFAVQGVSSVFDTYLGQGVTNAGAAESHDGGVTWSPGYEGIGGVSVELFGTGGGGGGVPEPATWAMMLIGFAGVGFAMRGRRTAATAEA